jgi:hypothetical protein
MLQICPSIMLFDIGNNFKSFKQHSKSTWYDKIQCLVVTKTGQYMHQFRNSNFNPMETIEILMVDRGE